MQKGEKKTRPFIRAWQKPSNTPRVANDLFTWPVAGGGCDFKNQQAKSNFVNVAVWTGCWLAWCAATLYCGSSTWASCNLNIGRHPKGRRQWCFRTVSKTPENIDWWVAVTYPHTPLSTSGAGDGRTASTSSSDVYSQLGVQRCERGELADTKESNWPVSLIRRPGRELPIAGAPQVTAKHADNTCSITKSIIIKVSLHFLLSLHVIYSKV